MKTRLVRRLGGTLKSLDLARHAVRDSLQLHRDAVTQALAAYREALAAMDGGPADILHGAHQVIKGRVAAQEALRADWSETDDNRRPKRGGHAAQLGDRRARKTRGQTPMYGSLAPARSRIGDVRRSGNARHLPIEIAFEYP